MKTELNALFYIMATTWGHRVKGGASRVLPRIRCHPTPSPWQLVGWNWVPHEKKPYCSCQVFLNNCKTCYWSCNEVVFFSASVKNHENWVSTLHISTMLKPSPFSPLLTIYFMGLPLSHWWGDSQTIKKAINVKISILGVDGCGATPAPPPQPNFP